jgi:hypothetical protein
LAPGICALAALTIAGCDAAAGVEVEPLPPLERPTAESRAGLPSVTGIWRFAGWEVASAALAAEMGAPPAPGDVALETQRIDSVAGYFVRGEAMIPLVGEVRRDGVLSLASLPGEVAGRFAAGRVVRDTLWIELSTLPFGELSSPTVRWAFVRGEVGQAFFRLPTGELLRDTVVALPPEPDTAIVEPAPAPAPTEATETPPPAAQPPAAAPQTPQTRPAPQQTPRAPPAPAETQPPQPAPQTRPAARPDTPATPAGARRPAQPQPADTARRLPPPGPRVDIPPRLR